MRLSGAQALNDPKSASRSLHALLVNYPVRGKPEEPD